MGSSFWDEYMYNSDSVRHSSVHVIRYVSIQKGYCVPNSHCHIFFNKPKSGVLLEPNFFKKGQIDTIIIHCTGSMRGSARGSKNGRKATPAANGNCSAGSSCIPSLSGIWGTEISPRKCRISHKSKVGT